MDDTEHTVTGIDIGNDDAEPENVKHLRELKVLFLHLSVDAVNILLAAMDTADNAGTVQPFTEILLHLLKEPFAIDIGTLYGILQHFMSPRP